MSSAAPQLNTRLVARTRKHHLHTRIRGFRHRHIPSLCIIFLSTFVSVHGNWCTFSFSFATKATSNSRNRASALLLLSLVLFWADAVSLLLSAMFNVRVVRLLSSTGAFFWEKTQKKNPSTTAVNYQLFYCFLFFGLLGLHPNLTKLKKLSVMRKGSTVNSGMDSPRGNKNVQLEKMGFGEQHSLNVRRRTENLIF